MSTHDYGARAWAAQIVCRPLGERAVDHARAWVALTRSVVATPRQSARALGELLDLLVLGSETHAARAGHAGLSPLSATHLANALQVALDQEIDEVTTARLVRDLARSEDLLQQLTRIAHRPSTIDGWRAVRIGR